MRAVTQYSFRRMSTKLQYEILNIGLKNTIGKDPQETEKVTPYKNFANHFVDDKENLKDIMKQLGEVEDDQERIKEELFMLLSFFILTIENRKNVIQNILVKNAKGLTELFQDFQEKTENEDDKQLMMVLEDQLQSFA